MTYEIYETETFSNTYETLDNNEKKWVKKIREKLKESLTGKILRYKWFREKKYLNKRLYFIVDEETKRILFIDFSSKKDQESTINFIINNMKELLNRLKNF